VNSITEKPHRVGLNAGQNLTREMYVKMTGFDKNIDIPLNILSFPFYPTPLDAAQESRTQRKDDAGDNRHKQTRLVRDLEGKDKKRLPSTVS